MEKNEKLCDGFIKLVLTLNQDRYEPLLLTETREELKKHYMKRWHFSKKEVDTCVRDMLTVNIIGDIFSGQEFVKMVKDGSLIDYDGHISHIFIDNMLSNLGLFTENLHSGDFTVDMNLFEKLCSEHTIEVEWVNK